MTSDITRRHVETPMAVSSMSTFIMSNSISEIRKKIDIDTKTHAGGIYVDDPRGEEEIMS